MRIIIYIYNYLNFLFFNEYRTNLRYRGKFITWLNAQGRDAILRRKYNISLIAKAVILFTILLVAFHRRDSFEHSSGGED